MNSFFNKKKRVREIKRFTYVEFSNMIVAIMKNIYVKDEKEALENESLESIRNYENYISAIEKTDTFNIHHYNLRDVKALNLGDRDLENLYASENAIIPDNLKQSLLEIKRAHIIEDFEEMNNYYRMLSGLPPYGDVSQYIYLDKEFDERDLMRYSEYTNVPIHELPSYVQESLIDSGDIDKLIDKYGYKYLEFLGSNEIPLRFARDAKDFDLLRCNPNINMDRGLIRSFKEKYSINRSYMLNLFMVDHMYNTQELYHAFFAMMIIMITVNSLISENLENIIGREYIDDFNYDVFLESYNLHSLKDLSLRYKKILVKNFNYLLKYKGSDRVIVDICKLFGFKDVRLMKTYLCKTHRFSGDNPVFRDVEDENGNIVPDYDFMYDLKFIDVPYDSSNIAHDIANSDIVLDYNSLAYTDNYWGGGEISKEVLKQQILKLNFNQILTKYVSLNNMYNVTELTFETSHIFSLIFKLRRNFQGINLNMNGLVSRNVPVFDLMVYLYTLFSKKYGYTGEIITSFSSNLSFKGFNVNSDLTYLKKLARELKLNINIDRLSYLGGSNDVSIIESLYMDLRALRDRVYNLMIKSENINEYRKLKIIYDAMMHTQLNRDIYSKRDGTIAGNYNELLEDINPTLHDRLVNHITDTNVVEEITKVLDIMDTSINRGGLKYLFANMEIMELSRIQENLYSIINFFKAHTVQLRDMNTIYTIDDRYSNFIKAIDQVTKSNLTYRQLILEIATDNCIEIFKMKDTSVESISRAIMDKVTKELTFKILSSDESLKAIITNSKSKIVSDSDLVKSNISTSVETIRGICGSVMDKITKMREDNISVSLYIERDSLAKMYSIIESTYSKINIITREDSDKIIVLDGKDIETIMSIYSDIIEVGKTIDRSIKKSSRDIIDVDLENLLESSRDDILKIEFQMNLIIGTVAKDSTIHIKPEIQINRDITKSLKDNITVGDKLIILLDGMRSIYANHTMSECIEIIHGILNTISLTVDSEDIFKVKDIFSRESILSQGDNIFVGDTKTLTHHNNGNSNLSLNDTILIEYT